MPCIRPRGWYAATHMEPRDLRPLARFAALSLTLFGAIATADEASAQVIVYGPQPAPYQQPVAYVAAPLPTYGNLVGRAAFYGRVSLGLGSDFFRITDDASTDSVALLSGPALHTDFSLGVRFAFVHALTLDFDLDRGFSPTLDGDSFPSGISYSGALGVGYTNFLSGTGLYFGAGLGLGIAWVEYDDGLSTTASTNTGVGLAAHGRIGYDWTFGRRAHVGVGGTLRFYNLTDEDSLSWRGASLSAAASFGWY